MKITPENRKNIVIGILIVIILFLLRGCNGTNPLSGGGPSGGSAVSSNCPVCVCDNHTRSTDIPTPCVENTLGCTDSRGSHLNTCSMDNVYLVSYRCSPDLNYCVPSNTRCSDLNSINTCMPNVNGALCGVPSGSSSGGSLI
jgi:hypothetical protein